MQTKLRNLAGLLYLFVSIPAAGQSYTGLQKLPGSVNVYYSEGDLSRASQVSTLTEDAWKFTGEMVGFFPKVTVLVLNEDDWSNFTSFPVYGMPHYKEDATLIVASSDNAFWRSFIPDLNQLPAALAAQVREAYGTEVGIVSMQPFFDLLALHELGHAFHKQAGLNVQRLWMGEFFCNLLLHTYVAERKPGLIQALTVFPGMVVGSGAEGFLFTTLKQFEEHYTDIAAQHPRNYGWYQCKLHDSARKVYEVHGATAFRKLWTALKYNQQKLPDQQFKEVLINEVHPSVADVYLKWE